jgi:hypothetical protein
MTRLAPHVLKPLEPPPGCLDMLAAWLLWALKRLALVGLGFVAGCSYHAMVVGK